MYIYFLIIFFIYIYHTDCNFKAADVKEGDCIYIAAFDLKGITALLRLYEGIKIVLRLNQGSDTDYDCI